MRLLTHNQLVCIRKGCNNAYPLQLNLKKVSQNDTEVNYEMVLHLLGRIDYEVLNSIANALGVINLPEQLPSNVNVEEHSELLSTLHTLLFDVNIEEGELSCPICSHIYPIQSGIPNMRLDETDL